MTTRRNGPRRMVGARRTLTFALLAVGAWAGVPGASLPLPGFGPSGFGAMATASAQETPEGQVAAFNETLLSVMKDADKLGFDGRYERLAPAISQLFNLPLMAQIAVGREWEGLVGEQRKALIDAFSRMSIATFAARFDGYSGERFEVVGAEEALRDAVLVKTNLIKSDNTPIALNYLTRNRTGEWRVIDVFLDARFSELARLRSDYGAVLARSGFDALIEQIKSRTAELAASARR